MGKPRRIRARAAHALAVACVCAGVSSGCGAEEPRRFTTSELTYEYPHDWRRVEHVSFPNAELVGDTAPADHVVGLDRDNWVTVYGDLLDAPMTARELAAQIPEIMEDYRRALRGSGVRVVSPPATVRIRSASGMRLRVAFSSAQDTPVTLELTTVYRRRARTDRHRVHGPAAARRDDDRGAPHR